MIYINFYLLNPWKKGLEYKNLYHKLVKVTKHKSIYIELLHTKTTLIGFCVDIHPFKTSHAGFDVNFALFGYSLQIEFFDNRHWNFEKDCWERNLESPK